MKNIAIKRFTVIPAISLSIFYFSIGLSVQVPSTLPEIPCSPTQTSLDIDSLEVVSQCSIAANLHWILAWGKAGNYILVLQGENTIIRRSHEEGEEGHIIRSKFYQSKKEGLYYILSVFGMEDGDISLKVYSLEGRILRYFGQISALTLGADREYTYVPLENIELIEKQAEQLDILFPDEEYEIWRKATLERWKGPLQYRLNEGQIFRHD